MPRGAIIVANGWSRGGTAKLVRLPNGESGQGPRALGSPPAPLACYKPASPGDIGASPIQSMIAAKRSAPRSARPPSHGPGPRTEPSGTGRRLRKWSGQGRVRTADLPLFRRTLVPTELPGRARGNAHVAPAKRAPSPAGPTQSSGYARPGHRGLVAVRGSETPIPSRRNPPCPAGPRLAVPHPDGHPAKVTTHAGSVALRR
jgi:hypothetical protein